MDNYDKGLDLYMKLTRLAHEWDAVKRLDYDDPIYVKWREENDRAFDEADALIREWTEGEN